MGYRQEAEVLNFNRHSSCSLIHTQFTISHIPPFWESGALEASFHSGILFMENNSHKQLLRNIPEGRVSINIWVSLSCQCHYTGSLKKHNKQLFWGSWLIFKWQNLYHEPSQMVLEALTFFHLTFSASCVIRLFKCLFDFLPLLYTYCTVPDH